LYNTIPRPLNRGKNKEDDMGKKEVEMKSKMEIEKAIEVVESLLAGLKKGKVFVQHGDKVVEITPEKTVKLEVEAEQKKDKEKISVRMTWHKKDLTKEIEKTIKNKEKEEEKIFKITQTAPVMETGKK
jgi:amphi-Trp domain-containing protein